MYTFQRINVSFTFSDYKCIENDYIFTVAKGATAEENKLQGSMDDPNFEDPRVICLQNFDPKRIFNHKVLVF